MRKGLPGLAVGVLLALTFQTPVAARANDPITFSFKDECGIVNTTVTNNSASTVPYTLATTRSADHSEVLGQADFTLEPGQTRTHRWLVIRSMGIRATSPALAEPVDLTLMNCTYVQPGPSFLPDCEGSGLGGVATIYAHRPGNPVFAVNGKLRTPFPPDTFHTEVIAGLKPADKIAFLIPALSEPHELVTWQVWTYAISPKCSHVPPVTVTPTCTGVNIKTVNTEQASQLDIDVLPSGHAQDKRLEQGESFETDLTMTDGIVLVRWYQFDWDQSPGDPPAAALLDYERPSGCDNSPSSPAHAGPQLPTTGAPTWILLSGGGLLLVLGAMLFVLTRRRRREPIA